MRHDSARQLLPKRNGLVGPEPRPDSDGAPVNSLRMILPTIFSKGGKPAPVARTRALSLLPIFFMAPLALGQTRTSSLTGDIRMIKQFHSNVLNNERDLIVYLPPDYRSNINRRYPVLYLNDGQNVFDGMTSFIPNKEWRADETAEALIEAGLIQPLIMVGIYNHGMERADEYLPTKATFGRNIAGGKADLYAKMVIEEIIPLIDKTYRTKKGPENTAICGSSFGGIVSLHIGLTHPKVFGKLGVLSPSVWWDNREILKEVDDLKGRPQMKIWLDIGTAEAEANEEENKSTVDNVFALSSSLQKRGWVLGRDLATFVDKGAHHNEDAWAHRMPMVLLFLFPK